MAWKVATPVEVRRQFILESMRPGRGGAQTFAALCAAYGISQKTGYKWRGRYLEKGAAGLKDASRRPHGNARSLSALEVRRVLGLKRTYVHWAGRKLRVLYRERWPQERTPAASTIDALLKAHGLVRARRKQRERALPQRAPSRFLPVQAPNDVWCIDFKGQFRLGDGRLCYPLTVTDAFSRQVLLVQGFHAIDMAEVKRALQGLFRRHGLPKRMRSDNGSPFGSGTGLGGLTQLSAWLVSLGVQPEFITPGRPQENGQHERFHLSMLHECCLPAERGLARQQRVFAAFVRTFNTVRPHEALGMRRPAEVWHPSPRPLPSRPASPSYPKDWEVRRVRPNGCVRWQGRELYVSAALARRPVGFEPQGKRRWMLRYYGLNLAVLDGRRLKALQVHPPLRASPMSPG
jgi:putative transposase